MTVTDIVYQLEKITDTAEIGLDKHAIVNKRDKQF
ncbi:hypothetical protein B4U80_07602 [Leptotrombidium deliense]|uniref:Uncharacterized protein n=1 Tax=Leptotrombidium deliense TaxID=299467 RepID=A0A443S382_9ACAR|nr:hypothetical protein B4U80_07602 [Leptotrombidium deliense]